MRTICSIFYRGWRARIVELGANIVSRFTIIVLLKSSEC